MLLRARACSWGCSQVGHSPVKARRLSFTHRCQHQSWKLGSRSGSNGGPRAAVRDAENLQASTPRPGDRHLGIYKVDPDLKAHSEHLNYRWQQYTKTKDAIVQAEGSLAAFAQGHKKMGIVREGGVTTVREWAPAAQAVSLIGDFSGWKEVGMKKDQWGVWEVTLPDVQGQPAIPHRSRIKVKLQAPGGWWVDRLSAWIRWATVEPGVMGAKYDGIHWDPPPAEAYKWRSERPYKPRSLRIYEAHVGMSSEEGKVASYTEFKNLVLPHIKAAGYTAVQLMAIQEHAYYGSFGYHVTNPFAVSSRSGTPDELKALIDEAHRLGLVVLLDVVHSHMSSNQDDGLAGFDLGQSEDMSYFHTGDRGYHQAWDSRCFNYSNWEVLRLLLSNLRYWLEEYKFDGFRFDGVTSMLYWDHGINRGFSGAYSDYFGLNTNVDACAYLMLANDLIHTLMPEAIVIAEDVSGMPSLCRPVQEGGLGFDYRLGMAIPDKWIDLLKNKRDEQWSMLEIVSALCNRRYSELTVGYAESHDQALVGDKTIAFRLMDAAMYEGMSTLTPATPVIERGISLHKVIRAVTIVLGGEAWLCFMGNEFGHPEWIDFPREGNDWSHKYCRRQWSLATQDHLRYRQLGDFDRALMELDDKFNFLTSVHQWVTHMDEEEQVLVAERGPLLFVFNFSPFNTYEGYRVAAPTPGKWRVALDSDAFCFGGKGRVSWDADHFSVPEPRRYHDRDQSMLVLSPTRSVVAYYRTEDYPEMAAAQDLERAERELAWRRQQDAERRSASPAPSSAVAVRSSAAAVQRASDLLRARRSQSREAA
ncbi:starch branching enzyme [Haematococcus lacustris]